MASYNGYYNRVIVKVLDNSLRIHMLFVHMYTFCLLAMLLSTVIVSMTMMYALM